MRALVSVLTTRRMPLCPCSASISSTSLIEIASRSPASAWPSAAKARASATAASAERDSASSTAARTPGRCARVARPTGVSRPGPASDVRLPTTCETTACSASGENGLPMKSTTLDGLGEARLQVVALAARRPSRPPGHAGQRRVAGETPANLGRVAVGDQPIEEDEVGNGARFAHQRQAGRRRRGRWKPRIRLRSTQAR